MPEIKKCPKCNRTIRYIRSKNEFHCIYCPEIISMADYAAMPVYDPVEIKRVEDMKLFDKPVRYHAPIMGSGRC